MIYDVVLTKNHYLNNNFHLQGSDFVVKCQIIKFETIHGWFYQGCSKCNSIPKPMTQGDSISELFCPGCKKKPFKLEPKYILMILEI